MFATWRTRAVVTRAMVLTAGLSLAASLAGCHPAPPPGQPAAHLAAATPGSSAGRPTAATGAAPSVTGGAPSVTGVPTAAACPAAPYGTRLYALGNAKTVALTFDDGPGRSTAAILASYQVTATFFNIGVAMAARPWTLELAQQGRMGVWMWSVDTLDWMAKDSDSSYWVQRIIRLAEQGVSQAHPIVLMHDGREGDPATVTALPAIIQFYRSHGYRFVAL